MNSRFAATALFPVSLVFSAVFFVFWLSWIVLFLSALPLALLIPRRDKTLTANTIEDSPSICRYLNQKEKLSDADYDFEKNQVAEFYDEVTFRGYQVLVWPVTALLPKTDLIDGLILFFVRRWIVTNQGIIENKPGAFTAEVLLARLCTGYAALLGRLFMPEQD